MSVATPEVRLKLFFFFFFFVVSQVIQVTAAVRESLKLDLSDWKCMRWVCPGSSNSRTWTVSNLFSTTASDSSSARFTDNLLILSNLSRSLADRWGTTVDFTTSFLHSSRFSAFRSMMCHSRPVQSLMLSSHRFLYLPLRLPPWTVPCRISDWKCRRGVWPGT